MIHGVSAPGLSLRPYFNRYTEDAIDLCDALSSFSPQGKATLHEISRVMSLPGKPKGIDGGEVERYFHEGKIKEIADYCETDIVNTYRDVAANRAASEALFDAGRPDQPLVRTQFGSDVYVHICGRHRHRIDSELLQPLPHRRRGQHLGGS